MADPLEIGSDEYLQIEEFISRTARGRAFLREHASRARGGAADQVRRLLEELRELWREQGEASNLANRVAVLRHELQDMSASISHARREIAALKPASGTDDHILSATNELDAIIMSTERASVDILSAAERIVGMVGEIRKVPGPGAAAADAIEQEVMTIFTACSFQDLTGQRTTKVINVLRYIEQRIGALIALWGVSAAGGPDAPPVVVDRREDAHLLNGPSSDGMDQDQVDRLLSAEPAPGGAADTGADGGGPQADGVPALDQSAVDALFR